MEFSIPVKIKIYREKDVDNYNGLSSKTKELEENLGIQLGNDEDSPPPPFKVARVYVNPLDIFYYMESFSPEAAYENSGDTEMIDLDSTLIKFYTGEEMAVMHTIDEFQEILKKFYAENPNLSKNSKKETPIT